MAILHRPWKDGDQVILSLPMKVESSRWYENSVAIERGPLDLCAKNGGEMDEKGICRKREKSVWFRLL